MVATKITYKRYSKNKEKETQAKLQKQPKTMNKMAISTYTIITLNVDGLNVPIKRHRLVEWI